MKYLIWLILPALISCSGNHSTDAKDDGGHELMVSELKQLSESGNPWDYYHWNSKRAALLNSQLDTLNGPLRTRVWFEHCHELLRSSETTECITEIESYLASNAQPYEDQLSSTNKPLFELLAIAYLRLGEQENCQLNHSRFSCIVPIQGSGIHRAARGSSKAIELYELLYSRFHEDSYRWLINLAYMTLGKHPESVPKELLLRTPLSEKSNSFPVFKETSEDVGLNVNGLSGSVCVEDFNNDGHLDLFMTSYGMEDNVKLFLADGKGGYNDATEPSGLRGIVSGLNCIHADYDNDGNIDIFVLRGAWLGKGGNHPNSLLRNLGNGKFQDITHSSGLLSYHPTQTGCWGDFDQDGDLDLFIGNESSSEGDHPCELYRNNGNGTFTEISAQVGLNHISEYVKGAVWGDIDNDSFPELFLSVLGGKNRLYKNIDGHFSEVSEATGVTAPWFGFTCWFWDANNDGYQDLFVGSYDLDHIHEVSGVYARELASNPILAETCKLYINNRDGTFKDETAAFGLEKSFFGMGANFGDLDNDGWLDFYIGTGAPDFNSVVPNRMFRNIDGSSFQEVTFEGRFGHVQKGHGVAFADLDADSDQDIYAVMGGAYEGDNFTNVLFQNPGFGNASITLKLVGNESGKSAIGTRVELTLNNGTILNRWVNTGGSFGSSTLHLFFGVGNASSANEVTVYWPKSKSQTFKNVSVNTSWVIVEGKPDLAQLKTPSK